MAPRRAARAGRVRTARRSSTTATSRSPRAAQGSDQVKITVRRRHGHRRRTWSLRRPGEPPGPADRGYSGQRSSRASTGRRRTGLQPDGVDAGRLQPAGSRSVTVDQAQYGQNRSGRSPPAGGCGRSRRTPPPPTSCSRRRVRRRRQRRARLVRRQHPGPTQGDLLDGNSGHHDRSRPRRGDAGPGHHPDDGGGGQHKQGMSSPDGRRLMPMMGAGWRWWWR